MLTYGLVGLSLLGVTVGAVVPATATKAKVKIAEAVCDAANEDVLSTLNQGDLQNLLKKYNCSVSDLESIASQCLKDKNVQGTTDTDCSGNTLLKSIKEKLTQSKENCKAETSDNKTTGTESVKATENTEKVDNTQEQTIPTECQDKNCVSDYVEKAKELLDNKSQINREDVKEFCNSVNNSPNTKIICSEINSDELKSLLEKFGFTINNNQCSTNQNATNTKPTESATKTEPATGNNTNSNAGNNNSNNNSNSNSGNQSQTKPTTGNTSGSVSQYEKRVVELVNEIRVQNGLSKLTLNTELSAVARLKSQDMKDKNYFSHTSPTYGSPFDMMKQFGISYRTAGENIAYGYATPESVVDGWMNSPGHRANILNSSYKEIGVGYVSRGHYWTQMFIG